MAKYVITFVLLLCLALENDNIYNRLHARSHPSSRADGEHQQYQQLQLAQHHAAKQHTPQQQQHYTRQQRARQHKHIAPDPSDGESEGRYNQRLRRHMHHQRQQHIKQLSSYHHSKALDELKSVPRLWQHLGGTSYENLSYEDEDYAAADPAERMFGDAPDYDADSNLLTAEMPPLVQEAVELQSEKQTNKSEQQAQPSAALNSTKPSSNCPKCESNRQVEHITEEELTRLRIEFVKQQILEKLRLKESPKVAAVELPKPIFEGVTLTNNEESAKNKDDDYYARTNKKFIFLKREYKECQRLDAQPSMCFSFKIDDADADSFDVSSAVLWLFKNKQNQTFANNGTEESRPKQTIVVSEVEQQLDSKYLPLAKTIAIKPVDVQDEWLKIHIEWPIKSWFGNHELSHLIQITCESCDISSMQEMISVGKDYKPFIMIDTQNRRGKSRSKRSINCSDGVTECCRDKLYISFADIGWNNWILQPAGYDAYFCRGSCNSVASVTQAASHHSSLLKILSSNGTRKPLELIPCCTAKQYSSLQLVVMDSNNTATVKTLPNMVVESCGCR